MANENFCRGSPCKIRSRSQALLFSKSGKRKLFAGVSLVKLKAETKPYFSRKVANGNFFCRGSRCKIRSRSQALLFSKSGKTNVYTKNIKKLALHATQTKRTERNLLRALYKGRKMCKKCTAHGTHRTHTAFREQ